MSNKLSESTEKEDSESKKSWDKEKKLKNKIKLIEKKIEELEFEKISILSKFHNNLDMNPEKIVELSKRLELIKDETENLERDWEELV
jgi:hypothetical protein